MSGFQHEADIVVREESWEHDWVGRQDCSMRWDIAAGEDEVLARPGVIAGSRGYRAFLSIKIESNKHDKSFKCTVVCEFEVVP